MSEENNALAAEPAEEIVAPPSEKPEAEKPEVTEGDKPEGEKPETAEEDGGEEPEKRKKPSGAERAKRRLQLATAELDRMARENEELRSSRQPSSDGKGKPGIDREPTEADFPNDYFAYERARVVWDTRQAVREEMNRERSSKQEDLRREIHAERLEAWEDSKEIARERIPDFDKVVNASSNVSVKPELAEEILASDKSALLQYHLAKNPDKVRELNQMTGRELAREIGRLESRIHLPSPKKATEATPPPSQPRGGATPPVNLQNADMDAYVAQRNKELTSSR